MIDSKTLAETLLKFSTSDDAEKKINNFFYYLEKKNLLSFLPQIKRYLLQKQKSSEHFNTLYIRSRFSLYWEDIEEIIRIIGVTKDAPVEFIQDENIIGGFQVIYKEKIYDGSLFHKIDQFENTLIQS